MAQGMGRTLNISEGGILLETHIPMDLRNAIALDVGLEDDLINIKGTVVFSGAGKDKKYEAGIEFLEMSDSTLDILKKFIIAFSEQ